MWVTITEKMTPPPLPVSRPWASAFHFGLTRGKGGGGSLYNPPEVPTPFLVSHPTPTAPVGWGMSGRWGLSEHFSRRRATAHVLLNAMYRLPMGCGTQAPTCKEVASDGATKFHTEMIFGAQKMMFIEVAWPASAPIHAAAGRRGPGRGIITRCFS